MTIPSIYLQFTSDKLEAAVQYLSDGLLSASKCRDFLIDYDGQDTFSVAVYDALVCMLEARAQQVCNCFDLKKAALDADRSDDGFSA